MATLVLAAAGAAAGSAAGAALGAGLAGAGAALGRAAGGVLGGMIDQRVLGDGAEAVDAGRVAQFRVMSGREGAPIPRVYGRMRVGGQVVWASRFREETSSSGGGKGGAPTVRSHRYSVSLAVALCEGPVERIGRVWADGALLDLSLVEHRLHRGTEDQAPDPLIEAIEGSTPAYRGTAYVVFEELDLGRFGNRVPQFNVEVFRQPKAPASLSEEIAPPLSDLVRAVALSPGSGEFSLNLEPVRRRIGPGASVTENVNGLAERADALVAFDQLQEEAPACRAASLVVSWFGDDLRCGQCRIRPGVETRAKLTEPVSWRAGGVDRASAALVGQLDGRPVFGGTPSDDGVAATLREMKRRGVAAMFYPFILMDVAPGSGRPSPYGGEQPAYPWRGRITLDVAPGLPGSVDRTAAAEAQVAAFFGSAQASDFSVAGDAVSYHGPEEWGLRRFILHYAHLCAAAGGVDAFCVGSELRGLTWIRSGPGRYPAVTALRALAADVRAILGPTTKIGYAADWSEYFGHQPADGSGDAAFHLDPLWADAAIDFVGVDNYMPLADWRDGEGHLDAAAGSAHSLAYLRSQVEGGEGFDWYYATDADRAAQRRSPITDGAHDEAWMFRHKDIRSWWSREHHDRIGGVRSASPTAWVPMSKPFWFTEIGCPAVDKGANQPNVFVDPKSSESALPYASSGARDDAMQRRYLQAALGYWEDAERNPVSPVYGAPMVDPARAYVWTWDLRPWPDFPQRLSVWSDGENHRLGHWITGRLGGAGLAETVAEICGEAGVASVDVSGLHDVIDGTLQEATQTARAALQPLMVAFGFDMVEHGEGLRFIPRGARAAARVAPQDCVADGDGAAFRLTRSPAQSAPDAVRVAYHAGDGAYEAAVAEARLGPGPARRVEAAELGVAMAGETAQDAAERLLHGAHAADEEARFVLPPSSLALEAGDVALVETGRGEVPMRVDRVIEGAAGASRAMTARRVDAAALRRARAPARTIRPPQLPAREPVELVAFEVPAPDQTEPALLIACVATPWPGPVSVWRDDAAGPPLATLDGPATMGALALPAPDAAPGRWAGGALEIALFGGALAALSEQRVLAGGNRAALRHDDGSWEALQFAGAELVAPRRWRLTGLLRGQAGSEAALAAPAGEGARFVLLDAAVGRIPIAVSAIGAPVRLIVGPSHLPPESAAHRVVEVAPEGLGLRPWAPAHLAARREPDGALALSWVRRARLGGDAWGVVEPPVGEEVERYRVTARMGDAVVRQVDVAAPFWRYGAAEQAADAAPGGALGGALTVSVAQLSATVGPGWERRVLIDV